MALCGRACHAHVHDETLDGKTLIRAKGGRTGGNGLRKLHDEGFFTSEFQSKVAKMGTGESKAKGARVANAIKVGCPDCGRVMNPGALGMHKRVHGKVA